MQDRKAIVWIASSLDDLWKVPVESRRVFGQALDDAQLGHEHPAAKALKGFGDRSVLEVVEDHDGETYRAVYTVRFAGVIYVLHVFQKKSKKGIATPKHEMDLIAARLKQAETHYRNMIPGRGKR